MAKKNHLDLEYLHSVLSYNSQTGVFTWNYRDGFSKSWNTRYAGKQAGWEHGSGYLQTCIKYKKYYLHRLAWFYVHGEWPKEIDHKDLNKKNNSICNLRDVTHSQNGLNRKCKKNKYGTMKGVSYCKRDNTWRSNITVNKKEIILGYFNCPASAHFAYIIACDKYHGEFARFA